MPKVITIGRQFGSGGHEVGLRLSKKMGIPFYDKEIIRLTAKNSRFAESYLERMDEQKPSFLNIGSAGILSGAGGISYGQNVCTGQVHHMDVVPDTGSVRSVVVVSEHCQMVAPSDGDL